MNKDGGKRLLGMPGIKRGRLRPFLFWSLALILLLLPSLYSYLLFHTVLEIFGALISLSIVIIVWKARRYIEASYIKVLAVGLLFSAVIEVAHLLTYSGIGIFTNDPNVPDQLWMMMRLVDAAFMCVVALAVGRQVKIRYILIISGPLISVGVIGIFLGLVPNAYLNRTGLTSVKVLGEYGIIALFTVSAFLLYRRRRMLDPSIFNLIVYSIFFGILAEVCFTSYLTIDPSINMLGHLLFITELFIVFQVTIRVQVAAPERVSERGPIEHDAKFRRLVENADGMVFEYGPGPRFGYISASIERMIGYSSEMFIDDPDLLRTITMEEDRKTLDEVLAMDKTDSSIGGVRTIQVRSKDGRPIWLEISSITIADQEGRMCLAGVCRDITGSVMSEAQLSLADHKLEMLGTMTRHDVLNKITVAYGYIALADRHVREENARTALRKASESINSIAKQMEFTREYQGLGSEGPVWIELGTAFEKGVSGVDIGRVTIEYTLDNVEIYADRMVEKVFHNLVLNSIKHGRNVTMIKATCSVSQDGLAVIIEDDGIGIPERDRSSMFEWTYKGRGGHGLHLVSEILALTGITISEIGSEGKGAIFRILVPEGKYKILIDQASSSEIAPSDGDSTSESGTPA